MAPRLGLVVFTPKLRLVLFNVLVGPHKVLLDFQLVGEQKKDVGASAEAIPHLEVFE